MRLTIEAMRDPIGLDTATPHFAWSDAAIRQVSRRITVRCGESICWDTGWMDDRRCFDIPYEGTPLAHDTVYACRVEIRSGDGQLERVCGTFQTGMLGTAWPAKWVTPSEDEAASAEDTSPRLKGFMTVRKPLERATAYIYTNGFYELYVGETRVGDRVQACAMTGGPNWDGVKRVLPYDTYDVTHLLRGGRQAVGLWLGDGASESFSEWGWSYRGAKKVILLITLHYADGTADTFGTDESWLCRNESPILHNSLYGGEWYDTRLDSPWLNEDETDWRKVFAATPIPVPLKSEPVPAITTVETVHPMRMWETKRGSWIFDMGQNFSGVCRLTVRGAQRGQMITLKHAEDEMDGELDTYTNRHADAQDTYVCCGDAEEVWQPRFTFHGFRFVEMTGYPGVPALDALIGLSQNTELRRTGHLITDNARLNRFLRSASWGMRSNFAAYPSDTPSRDERTPCMMDSCVYEEAAMHLFDLHAWYTRWLRNSLGANQSPDWGGDQVSLCYHLWRYYGDTAIVRESWPYIKTWLNTWLNNRDENGLIQKNYGDWAGMSEHGAFEESYHDVPEVNTALLAYQLDLAADMADVADDPDAKAEYTAAAGELREAFVRAFWDEERGSFADSLTPNALALCFHIGSEEQLGRVRAWLMNDVQRDKTMRVGIFGNRFLPEALMNMGQSDLVLHLLTTPDYPGFGWQMDRGATTMWEQWMIHGGMESHNHAMFTGAATALFTKLSGVTAIEPGYGRIRIAPMIPQSLNMLDFLTETPHGSVAVRWSKEGSFLTIEISAPLSTDLTLALPSGVTRDVPGGHHTIRIPLEDVR